jgi:hypothetical protein
MSSKAMRQKTTNKMIMNQTAIDWIASILLIANASTIKITSIPQGAAGELYCGLWDSNYKLWSILNALSFNLMALTLERFYAVVKPTVYKTFTPEKAKLAMFSVWMAGFAITLPNILANTAVGEGECRTCQLDNRNTFSRVAGIINYMAVFIAPVVLMVICYSQMILVFRKKTQIYNEDSRTSVERQRSLKMRKVQLNILKTFLIVSAAFIICWAPSQTMLFIFYINPDIIDLSGRLMKGTIYLTFANCLMNPFIYTFQYYDFQVALKSLFGRGEKNLKSSILF